jgi:hypothetical protein
MEVKVMFREVETIPEDASVCHYDELSDRAKYCLACLVREDAVTLVEHETANELIKNDIIKFTSYYELHHEDPSVGSQVSV